MSPGRRSRGARDDVQSGEAAVSLRRKLAYLLPWRRRAEDRDIRDELDALREIAGPAALGNLALAAEDARATLTWTWIERLVQDVRYTLRSIRRQKTFAALVITSLALGIGASTAIFSFTESVLLRPLPVREPDALVVMKWRAKEYTLASTGMSWSTGGSSFDQAGRVSSIFPYAALKVFDDADDVVDRAFCYFSATRLAVTANGETEPVKGVYVSGEYFQGMGVSPTAGRLIHAADDDPAMASVTVISHRLSVRRFGGADRAVGQTVRINDKPFVVIGVTPDAFFGAEPGAIPDVYVPMKADSILESAASAAKYADEHFYWIEIMARLRQGVSLAAAQSALAPRFHHFVEGTATTERQRQDLPALMVQAGATGLDNLRRQYAQPIYILIAMVGLILLIACSNIASLLLSRASARRREIAVRLSIGASRARVIRQLLTESVMLASIGGVLGIAVAWWGIGVLTQLLANGRDNFTLHAELNWTVLAATLGLALVTGVLFGLAPALQAARVEIAPALKDVRANPATRRRGLSLGRPLVVAQIGPLARARDRSRSVRTDACQAPRHRARVRSRERAAVCHPPGDDWLSGAGVGCPLRTRAWRARPSARCAGREPLDGATADGWRDDGTRDHARWSSSAVPSRRQAAERRFRHGRPFIFYDHAHSGHRSRLRRRRYGRRAKSGHRESPSRGHVRQSGPDRPNARDR